MDSTASPQGNNNVAGFILKFFPGVAILLFCVAAITAAVTPIYPDEYGYLMINARAIFDQFKISSIFPPCQSSFDIQMPLLWYPGRLFYWAVYAACENARYLRLVGVLLYIALISITTLFCRELFEKKIRWELIFAALAAVTSLGVMPSVFVFNRPETVLSITLAWLVFAPLTLPRGDTPLIKIAIFTAHLFVVSLFFSSHGKTILFTPLALASTYILSRKIGFGWKAAGLASLLLIFPIISSYRVYNKFSSCPDSQAVAKIYSSQYFVPDAELLKHPAQLIKTLAGNVLNAVPALKQNLFTTSYPIGWLPGVRQSRATKLINFSAMGLYYALCAGILVFFLWSSISALSSRHIGSAQLIFLTLVQGILILVSVQHAKHFYESALTIPCIIFAAILIISQTARRGLIRQPAAKAVFISLLLLFCASSVRYSLKFFPVFMDGFAGPSISIAKYDHKAIKRDIEAAAAACAISNSSATKHLVVDDLTYLFFKKTRQPYSITYLAGSLREFSGPSVTETSRIFPEIKKLKVSAIVQRCDYNVIPAWGQILTRAGDICCVSQDSIENSPGHN